MKSRGEDSSSRRQCDPDQGAWVTGSLSQSTVCNFYLFDHFIFHFRMHLQFIVSELAYNYEVDRVWGAFKRKYFLAVDILTQIYLFSHFYAFPMPLIRSLLFFGKAGM